MTKNGQFWEKYGSKLPLCDVCFGPGPVHLQTRVRVRELDPGTRVSDPGLDALIYEPFSHFVVIMSYL